MLYPSANNNFVQLACHKWSNVVTVVGCIESASKLHRLSNDREGSTAWGEDHPWRRILRSAAGLALARGGVVAVVRSSTGTGTGIGIGTGNGIGTGIGTGMRGGDGGGGGGKVRGLRAFKTTATSEHAPLHDQITSAPIVKRPAHAGWCSAAAATFTHTNLLAIAAALLLPHAHKYACAMAALPLPLPAHTPTDHCCITDATCARARWRSPPPARFVWGAWRCARGWLS